MERALLIVLVEIGPSEAETLDLVSHHNSEGAALRFVSKVRGRIEKLDRHLPTAGIALAAAGESGIPDEAMEVVFDPGTERGKRFAGAIEIAIIMEIAPIIMIGLAVKARRRARRLGLRHELVLSKRSGEERRIESIGFGAVRAPEDAINQRDAGGDDIRFRQDHVGHVAVTPDKAVVDTSTDVSPDCFGLGVP
jgi:hypothetical protein